MRVAMVNMLHVGSTGKIMFEIAKCARASGHEVRTYSPRLYQSQDTAGLPFIEQHHYFGSAKEHRMHILLAKATGFHGCFSWIATRQLLKMLDDFQPEVIHLHNLHNWTVDVGALFSYIKKQNIKVVWTLHDCWSMTGRCAYFTVVACERWKTGCHHCPSMESYPSGYVDQSRTLWKLKKKWFNGVENMLIITPSQWLAGIVKQSYLAEYPLKVVNNGINLSVFKVETDIVRNQYGIRDDEYLVLGVAFDWSMRKGLDVFVHLAARLDKKYRILLVGTDDYVDKRLPDNIISIHRTNNVHELALLYNAANVFVNPTREDTYPTTNFEALACGTPVITFKTGGAPETVDETCGSVVECNDEETLEKEIIRVCTERPYTQEACVRWAKGFDMHERFEDYVRLYEEIV